MKIVFALIVGVAYSAAVWGADGSLAPLAESLTLHASFDGKADAEFAAGDARIYTANSLSDGRLQPGVNVTAVSLDSTHGRWGGSLRFSDVTDKVLMFKASRNVAFRKSGFQGTVSLWLSLDPARDLKPGFVDPIQITDKKWNDASFFVDFTKENPRQFRLGVFSDFRFWNPTEREWEDISVNDRPMVVVDKPPFGRDRWTHVAWTFADFNRGGENGTARFYMDGKFQGEMKAPQKFTWDPEKARIMLGIKYIGGMDDLAIFDRALTSKEVVALIKLEGGCKLLRKAD